MAVADATSMRAASHGSGEVRSSARQTRAPAANAALLSFHGEGSMVVAYWLMASGGLLTLLGLIAIGLDRNVLHVEARI